MRWSVQGLDGNERDEALVLRAQGGDGRAVEELMRRYKNAVRATARRFTFHPVAETDDLVQEGMIGLYAAIGAYRASAGKSFKNFVYTCVVRRVCSYLRAANRNAPAGEVLFDPETIAEGATPEDLLLDGESDAEFRLRLMRELSDFEFRVVTNYLEGMSYSQICEATGKDRKSVDNALFRSKRKLMKAFSDK